jgi:site-specific DNA recombinase
MTAVTLDRPAAHVAAGRVPFAYNRLSSFRVKDLDVEVTRAVYRQRDDADAACKDRDWPAPIHITDEGQSASRFAKRARDGWPVLLDAIHAGRVSYVLVWLLDRAVRQTRDLDDLLDACRETGTLILQTGTGTIIDADNPDSVAMAKIQGALAEAEVAKMSKRVRRAHADKARLGQFHGGTRRYGYNADMSEIVPAEAAVIRRVADDIIKGRTLYMICKELTDNGTPPPGWDGEGEMPKWHGSNLGKMMRRPHLAGLRTHNGILNRGTWEPVLEPEVWESVVSILTAPGRRTSPVGTARRHLLSGILTCDACGGPMRAQSAGPGKPGLYACADNFCTQRPRHKVEAVVVAEILGRISRPDFAAAFLADDDADDRAAINDRIETVERKLVDHMAREMRDEITVAQLRAATEIGQAEIAGLKDRLAALAEAKRLPAMLDGLAGNPDAAAAWDALDLDRRRAVVAGLVDVRVRRAARRGAPFDPESVVVTWKSPGGDA